MIRRLGSSIVVALLMLTGCRFVSEQSSLAQTQELGGVTAVRAQTPDVDVDTRRIWAGGLFFASSVSPDGRYVTMIDFNAPAVAVRDLTTGEDHHVTSTEDDLWEVGPGVFSRDGRRIAYSWYRGNGGSLGGSLRVVDFVSGAGGPPSVSEPRIVYANPSKNPYYLWDWSPDGEHVLGTLYNRDRSVALTLFSSAGGPAQALKTFDWREPQRAVFSPDGQFVAYDFPSDSDPQDRDIYVLSIDGSRESLVVDGPGMDRLLGWHPHAGILFLSDRDGTPGLWRQPASGGRALGPPELVRADMWSVAPLGFAGETFYYGVLAEKPTLQIAGLDFSTGRLTSAPVRIDHVDGEIKGWTWSPDGEYLATFVESMPPRKSSAGVSLATLVLRASDGQEISSQPLNVGLSNSNRWRWHPDGSIVTYARDDKGRLSFYRIDLESGAHEWLRVPERTEMGEIPRGEFDLSPDGRTLYFARWPGMEADLTIVAHDIATGAERRIAPTAWSGVLALSPDGSTIAYYGVDENGEPCGNFSAICGVFVASVAGGSPRELFHFPEGYFTSAYSHLNWTPDGRHIVWPMSNEPVDDWSFELWAVSLDGDVRSLGTPVQALSPTGISMHPDGRRIAFMAGESLAEIWAMDGLGAITTSGDGSR